MDEYDVIVIGAGAAGENAAQYAVEDTGLTGVLIEAELVGGECSYWACMPSKALLRPLEVVASAQHLGGVEGARVVPAGLLARRDEFRSHLDDAGQVAWAESVGLDVVRGRARLTGPREVAVASDTGTRVLRARQAVVLATGSVPRIPRALADVSPWTSRDATGVQDAPGRLAVVGGGVVACEAATWLSALGSDVTLLVRGRRLLSRSEPFAADAVAEGLVARGVTVRFGADVSTASRVAVLDAPEVGRRHGGPVVLTVSGTQETFDEVLVGTGRRPAVDDLGLDAVGLAPDDLDGRVDLLGGWLYAVGDVTGGPQVTHWGKYQARRVGEMIADRAFGRTAPDLAPADALTPVPQAVFTDPQVAHVGATEAAAREAGRGVRVIDQPFSSTAGHGLLRDDAGGTARLVLDGDVIIGATFVGQEVAELLHAATVAIVGRVPLDRLRDAVPAYPTSSEIWLRLVESAVRG